MTPEMWQTVWQAIKDVLLAFFTLITTVVGLRYGYLKWLKPEEVKDRRSLHEENVENREEDRKDESVAIRELRRIVKHQQDRATEDQRRCDERISKLEIDVEEHRRLRHETEIRYNDRIDALRTEVEETQSQLNRYIGMNQELTKQRDDFHEEVKDLRERVVLLHNEVLKYSRGSGQ